MSTQQVISGSKSQMALVLAMLMGVAGLLAMALPASAAVVPSVTAEVRNASNATVTTVPVGTMVHIRALVASSTSSTSPMGTADFVRYNGTICSGDGTVFEQNTALTNGIADSDAIAAPLGGASFRVHYDGQGDMFAEATSSCTSVAVNQFMPTIGLTLSSSTIYTGSSVYASTTFSNASSTSGGTLAYKVYTNNSCNNLYQNAGTKTVTNGTSPVSDSIQFNTAGTYYWQGVYSGDTNTTGATSSCAPLTVLASTTPPATGPGSISGKVYNDQNKNRKLDASEPGLSGFTIWLFKQSTKQYKEENAFKTVVSDANGNYSFTSLPDGKYRVEEKERKAEGWKQITKDFNKIEIKNGSVVSDLNFGNASTTKKQSNDDDRWNRFQDQFDSWWDKLQSVLQKKPVFSWNN